MLRILTFGRYSQLEFLLGEEEQNVDDCESRCTLLLR